MEDASEQKLIQLEPFAHQVGGHSSMLCLDGATVAKPLVVREQRFYETLPASLRPFVPSFLGALEVHVLQGEGGYVTHAAAPPPLYKPHMGIRTRRSRIRLHDSGDIEIEGENEGMVFEDDDDEDREHIAAKLKEEDLTQLEDEELQKVDRVPRPSVGHALNPWVLRCHRESLSGLTPGMSQNFILLENLTARFKQPCVLDLKIGTRQYGDSASPAKVRSKMMKVVTTTSGKLGLRLGGMQVYQVTTRRFLCRNKLFGRTLTVDGFRMALVQFLHNGWCIRLDIVRPLLERLEALEAILSRLGAARFYTCSLLCLYEGELRTPSTTPLSPSTPAPPMTPGPFSAMPPGFFTSSSSSNRFNFPMTNQASMELSHSPSSLNGKLANVLANGKENAGVWGDVARSSPFAHAEQRNHTFPNSSSDCVSPAVETSTPHNSEVHGVSACISSSSSNSRRMAAVEEATSHSSKEPASPGIRESSGSQSKITPQATVLPSRSGSASQWSHLTDVGTCPSDVKPHGSPIRGSRSSSPFTPCPHLLPSEGTPPVKSSTSCDSLNSHKGIVPHNLAAAISPKLENLEDEAVKGQSRKSRQRRETLGRSVSADSVSFSRVRYNALKKNEWKGGDAWLAKNDSYSDTKVNGYVTRDKEDWTSRLKDVRKRSRSLEPQISLYPSSINQSPYFDDGAVSHYTSISANPLVDVRLIDFAHSTHRGLSDPVTYAGPDQGFLFGLHNLINLLRDIAHEAMTATEKF